MSGRPTPARIFGAAALIILGPFWASAAAFMLGTSVPYVVGFALAGLGVALLLPLAGWLGRIGLALIGALGAWLILRWSAA